MLGGEAHMAENVRFATIWDKSRLPTPLTLSYKNRKPHVRTGRRQVEVQSSLAHLRTCDKTISFRKLCERLGRKSSLEE
jgi:hypothetical protein